MQVPFVDLNIQYQSLKKEMDQAVIDVLEQSVFCGGEAVSRFEREFAEFIGSRYAMGCGNGTDALEMALEVLQIGKGDEVIVPAMTWISTASAVSRTGAQVVFADVLEDEFTLDPADVERKITAKTKAIIPVHLHGRPARMDQLLSLAESYQLKIIEDCAQSHGAKYQGQMCGTFGDLATFSFYPGKNLGAYGHAGAVLTNNEKLAAELRMLGNHGQPEKHHHLRIGRNSNLDTLQAAVLNVKLPYLEQWTEKRIQHAHTYQNLLKDSRVKLPFVPMENRHVFHVYAVRLHKRNQVARYLADKNIITNIHYPTALPFTEAYAELHHTPSDFPVASALQHQWLSLPMYPELTNEQMEYVCRHLMEFLVS